MKNRARTVAHFTKVKVFTAAFYAVKNGKAKRETVLYNSLLVTSFVGWSCTASHFTPLGSF